MDISCDSTDDFNDGFGSQQTDDGFGGNDAGFSDSDASFADERHNGKFESEAAAMEMLRSREFRSWICKWVELTPDADSVKESESSAASAVAEPDVIGSERSAVVVKKDDLLGVYFVSVVGKGDYLPDEAWCRGETDEYADAMDASSMFGGSDSDEDVDPARDSASLGIGARAFEKTHRLVAEDVGEINAIPGISAGFYYPSAASPKIHVWLAVNLEARYQLDEFRAQAWMADTTRRVVQRIDFSPGYTRDELAPEVKKALCGATDVWDLNQRQLRLERSCGSRDLGGAGEVDAFGLQYVVNKAVKDALILAWPPVDLDPRAWERPDQARLHDVYQQVVDLCGVSAALAKKFYAYYKATHGDVAGDASEVFALWEAARSAASGSTLARDVARMTAEAQDAIDAAERAAAEARHAELTRAVDALSAPDAAYLRDLEERLASSVETFGVMLADDLREARQLLAAKAAKAMSGTLTLRAALGAYRESGRAKRSAAVALKKLTPDATGRAEAARLEAVWRKAQHVEWHRQHERQKLAPFLVRQQGTRRTADELARQLSSSSSYASASPPITAREMRVVRENESRLRAGNILARVVAKLDEQFDQMSTHCIICAKRLVYVEGGVDVPYESVCPSACDAKTCRFSYITMGVGLELGTQITHNTTFMTMLVCFLHSAANGGRVNLFYPSDLVAAGSSSSPRSSGAAPAGAAPPSPRLGSSFGSTTEPNLPRLQACLAKVPSLATMVHWAKQGIDEERRNVLFVELTKLDPLIVPLLRWMLATNNGYARMLTSDERLDVATPYQFQLLTSSARKEAQFQALKVETIKARRVLAKVKPAGRAKIVAALAAAKIGVVWSTKAVTATDGSPGFGGKDPLHEARGVLRIVLACVARANDALKNGAQTLDETRDEKAALKIINARKGSAALQEVANDVVVKCAADKNYWGRKGWGACEAGAPGKTGVPAFDNTDPMRHGSIFGFHGSPLGNWHVIFRTGLKNATLIPNVGVRGTAHGPGIYFGYDGHTSWGYADAGASKWPHTEYDHSKGVLSSHLTMALAEIINRPEEFTTVNPYLVVPQEEFVMTRFFLVFDSTSPVAIKSGLDLLEPARSLAERYSRSLV